jgi:hypothetical protein
MVANALRVGALTEFVVASGIHQAKVIAKIA